MAPRTDTSRKLVEDCPGWQIKAAWVFIDFNYDQLHDGLVDVYMSVHVITQDRHKAEWHIDAFLHLTRSASLN
jgi:hypothetical protein